MFKQLRTTKWADVRLQDSPFLKQVPLEVLELMSTEPMQRHSHNWAITTECFNSFKALTDFWRILAVDDGLPQGYPENEGKDYQEFVIIVESKDHPVHAWLTHPEGALTPFYFLDPEPNDGAIEFFEH